MNISPSDTYKYANTSSERPFISVLLPVYNGADYLEEAIESILNQTYKNFEIIIINDGSTDDSVSIVKQFNDTRVRYYEQENHGLAYTLNRAIKLSRGKYLARQDQDDISLPERFEKQIAFMEAHPKVGMIGTWASILENKNLPKRSHKHSSSSLILKFELLFNNPFVHSSILIRKQALDEVGAYSTDTSRQPPEDYELWSRIARKFEISNIPEILHIYRNVPNSMSRDATNPLLDKVIKISAENITHVLGKENINPDIMNLVLMTHNALNKISGKPNFKRMVSILNKAADNISDKSGVNRNLLRDEAKIRLKTLKRTYIKFKYGRLFTIFKLRSTKY